MSSSLHLQAFSDLFRVPLTGDADTPPGPFVTGRDGEKKKPAKIFKLILEAQQKCKNFLFIKREGKQELVVLQA